jgi:uncharacterized protein (DUF2267 family)
MSDFSSNLFGDRDQEAQAWLSRIARNLHVLDECCAYHALRAVLHGLRDRLPTAEAAAIGDRLPLLIRGIYYEAWRPQEGVRSGRQNESLAVAIERGLFGCGEWQIDARNAMQAVLPEMIDYLDPSTLEKIDRCCRQDFGREVPHCSPAKYTPHG